MSSVPAHLKYTASHEWILDNGDGSVTIGITDHAQELLGDVVFVEVPEVGLAVSKGEEFSLIESVKAASDIYAPVSGEVVAVNEALEDAPETINDSAFKEGWIAKVKLSDISELDDLLDAAIYEANIGEEG